MVLSKQLGIQRFWLRISLAGLIVALVGIDIASTLTASTRSTAIPVSQLKDDGVPPGYSTRVAMARSDDSALSQPQALAGALSREQVIEMVYAALDSSGDLLPLLFEGAKVTIKPNIVEVEQEGHPEHRGVNTDARVVEGLIRWMDEHGPQGLQYTVAEASGEWMSPAYAGTKHNVGTAYIVNGYEPAGFVDMQQRLAADGIAVELLDANFGPVENPLQGIRLEPVPAYIDFPVFDGYWVHEAILDPDVLIDVPVMKTHTPQITVCLKNHIGIAAGVKYGIYKGIGGVEPGDPKLHVDYPTLNTVEREIVDLASIGQPDYCLVDAIMCKERGKTKREPQVRRNMVLAGTDMVAVDTVCARIMGLNPDNIPHLVLAAREGLGTMNPDQIEVVSEQTIEDSLYNFERPPVGSQGGRAHFGMGNRVWLLKSADGDDIDVPYLGVDDGELVGSPGVDGWSEPIQFSDDYIDFEAFYGLSNGKVYYAFTWIDVPQEQDAELWFTHDEPCAVWIGGEQVYRSTVTYTGPALPNEPTVDIHLAAGRSPLLVKLIDKRQTSPFVLNICGQLPDSYPEGSATYTDLRRRTNQQRYRGKRVFGLEFIAAEASGIEEWERF